jgi:hypothetical protein
VNVSALTCAGGTEHGQHRIFGFAPGRYGRPLSLSGGWYKISYKGRSVMFGRIHNAGRTCRSGLRPGCSGRRACEVLLGRAVCIRRFLALRLRLFRGLTSTSTACWAIPSTGRPPRSCKTAPRSPSAICNPAIWCFSARRQQQARHAVGIYIGNGQFIHAPAPGGKVMISDLSSGLVPFHIHLRQENRMTPLP